MCAVPCASTAMPTDSPVVVISTGGRACAAEADARTRAATAKARRPTVMRAVSPDTWRRSPARLGYSPAMPVHRRTCPLCEAMCGLRIELEDGRVGAIRGDEEDPFSRGFICPKGATLGDLQHDPDRLTKPLRRRDGGWEPISWPEALREIVERLDAIRRAHGDDAIAVYAGNPTTHNYASTLGLIALAATLRTRSLF